MSDAEYGKKLYNSMKRDRAVYEYITSEILELSELYTSKSVPIAILARKISQHLVDELEDEIFLNLVNWSERQPEEYLNPKSFEFLAIRLILDLVKKKNLIKRGTHIINPEED